MIILKIILVLCVAEIYQIVILTIANRVDRLNHGLYDYFYDKHGSGNKEKSMRERIKTDYVRRLVATCIFSIFLAYKTVWFLW